MSSRLREYYKLCAVVPAELRARPLVDQIDTNAIHVVFTKKQAIAYIKQMDNGVTIRESIIGAAQPRQHDKITVI